MISPLKFCHGPRPMRSRALIAGAPPSACVLRYARQVLLPAPAPAASDWHSRSAPSMPPRSAPLPEPGLVTTSVIVGDCAVCAQAEAATRNAASDAAAMAVLFLIVTFLPACTFRAARMPGREPAPG